IRYGAWYLDPKTWKKEKVGEPLMDPKETGDSNPKYYGMHAFKEFLERKGYWKPGVNYQLQRSVHLHRSSDLSAQHPVALEA
uniref:Uncharacterized protein n=1 Tax=Apteryx owenii TaxID=8824 RepID=A0A8B9QMB0_APTOW